MCGRQGEALNQYLQKGTQVSLTGELDFQQWEKDGQKRSKVTIKVNNVQLLGGKQSNNNNGSNSSQGYSQQNNQINNSYQSNNSQQTGGGGNFEDDIPF